MNEEIKEISITFPGQILDYVDTKEHLVDLFNYITNLRQELKEANDSITWWSNRFNALQQENERLKKRNICGMNVVVSNETYNEYKSSLQDQLEDYKSRIDKAIEYCNNIMFETKKEEKIQDDLLNILKGDSDE